MRLLRSGNVRKDRGTRLSKMKAVVNITKMVQYDMETDLNIDFEDQKYITKKADEKNDQPRVTMRDVVLFNTELLQKNAEQQYIITNMELSIKKLTEIIGKKEEKISVLTEKNKALQKKYWS